MILLAAESRAWPLLLVSIVVFAGLFLVGLMCSFVRVVR